MQVVRQDLQRVRQDEQTRQTSTRPTTEERVHVQTLLQKLRIREEFSQPPQGPRQASTYRVQVRPVRQGVQQQVDAVLSQAASRYTLPTVHNLCQRG